MRRPRTRKAWGLPFGLATASLGLCGGSAVVDAALPKSQHPGSNFWAQITVVLVVGTALKYLYRWYLPPEQ
jgi:hypothetical protein